MRQKDYEGGGYTSETPTYQATYLGDYDSGVYNDNRSPTRPPVIFPFSLLVLQSMLSSLKVSYCLLLRCCEQATDSQCKYNLNHEVELQEHVVELQ